MEQLKPALTYEQQIIRLKDVHNLEITDDQLALSILQKVNYYRLSAYGLGLKKIENQEEYIDGISITHLYRLYEFDSLLRNITSRIIEQIEIQLRAQLSNYLALQYEAEGYMDESHFQKKYNKDGKTVHNTLIEDFQKEVNRQKNTPFVKHHVKKYGGHFPIWVAVELFSFGNLSSMYSIMKREDQREIAKLYNTDPKYLGSWILAALEIRNICAHYSRIYNMPLKQAPHLYPEYQKYRTKKNKIFPVILVIKRMLKSDERWQDYEKKLKHLIEEYQDVLKLSFMGFPHNWQEVLEL